MKMSAEEYIAEMEADSAFFNDNFLYTCLDCPVQGMYDYITAHCETVHNNNNFEISWPELDDRIAIDIMTDTDNVMYETEELNGDIVPVTEAIQEIIDDMTKDGNGYDVCPYERMLQDAEEIIARENAENLYRATGRQDKQFVFYFYTGQ